MKALAVTRQSLSNGLRFFHAQIPGIPGFDISMHVNVGSRDESLHNNGVSHFLEHMLFRGTRLYKNSIALAKALEQLGGESNAETGVESTRYWLKGSSRKLREALHLFGEFFLSPTLADFDIEKDILLQELANDYNEQGLLIDSDSLAMDALFPEHPLGLPIMGTEQTILGLKPDSLRAHLNLFYRPESCALVVVSSQSMAEILPWVEEVFGGNWNASSSPLPERLTAPLHLLPGTQSTAAQRHIFVGQNNPDNQYNVCLMFPAYGGASREVVIQNFLGRLLDDGISSRLLSAIREKNGLAYDLACNLSTFADIGTFSIEAIVSKDAIEKYLIALKDELLKILNERFTEEEVARVRSRYAFDLEMLPWDTSAYLERIVSDSFLPAACTPEQELEIVNTLTSDDILRVGQDIIGGNHAAMVLVGPHARKKQTEVASFFKTIRGTGTPTLLTKP